MSKLIVIPDSDPIPPWRYFCVIVTMNKRYGGGDIDCSSFEVYKDFKAAHKKEIAWAQAHNLKEEIYAYIHSGIALSLGVMNAAWPDKRWDAMRYGFIYVDKDQLLKELKWKRMSKKRIETARQVLKEEFEAWRAWAEGDCYLVAKVPDDFDELSDKLPDEYEYEFTGTYDECSKYVEEATTHD